MSLSGITSKEKCKVQKDSAFLPDGISGRQCTKDHDAEADDASWFSLDTALAKVSYKGDKKIVEKAKEMLNTTVTLIGPIPLNKGGTKGVVLFLVRYNP